MEKTTGNNKANDLKIVAFDWVFKGLIAVVCFLVKDMRNDIKLLMQAVPSLQAKVDYINDQRLLDKFRTFQLLTAKQEDEITYDSLKQKNKK
jgi:hypothetical protein